ncbi:MAG: crossover junction endodeoxyribonuclease RuvC [Planctomycetota bacterium]|nr:MAG: crossover junction endodeoxyribonuclease RuvC [Planctomycetota bacterium]
MPDNKQIVCGIDPGLRITGYGVLCADDDEDTISIMDAGIIRCSHEETLALRLAELATSLDEILDEHRVDVLAVEEIYSHYRKPRTAILMAHARGVILLGAAQHNIEVLHLPSTTVKKHLTGHGRANKEQMQRAVASTLSLSQIPEPPDVADALAIAICAACVLRQPAKLAMNNDDLLIK